MTARHHPPRGLALGQPDGTPHRVIPYPPAFPFLSAPRNAGATPPPSPGDHRLLSQGTGVSPAIASTRRRQVMAFVGRHSGARGARARNEGSSSPAKAGDPVRRGLSVELSRRGILDRPGKPGDDSVTRASPVIAGTRRPSHNGLPPSFPGAQ